MTRLAAVFALVASSAGVVDPAAGFAPYKGARLLCSEHVSGPTMHVTWQSYATRDGVETVVAHYEKATGRKATTLTSGERQIEWNADHKLGVYPAADNDRFPHCATKPTPEDQTVILISTAARP